MEAAEVSGELSAAEGVADASSQEGADALLAAGASNRDSVKKRDSATEELPDSNLPEDGSSRSSPAEQCAVASSSLQQVGDAAEPGAMRTLPDEQEASAGVAGEGPALGVVEELPAQSSVATAERLLHSDPASGGTAEELGRPMVLAADAGVAEEAAVPTTAAEGQAKQLSPQASSAAMQLDMAGNKGGEPTETTCEKGAGAVAMPADSLAAAASATAVANPEGSMQQPDMAALLPPTLAGSAVPETAASHASSSSAAVSSSATSPQDESQLAASEPAASAPAGEHLQTLSVAEPPVIEVWCSGAEPPAMSVPDPNLALAAALASQVQAECTPSASADPGRAQSGVPAQQEPHWGRTDTAMPPLEPGCVSTGGLGRCSEGREHTALRDGEAAAALDDQPQAAPKGEPPAVPIEVPTPAAEADVAVAGEAAAHAVSVNGAEAVPAVEADHLAANSGLPACQPGTDTAAAILEVETSIPPPAHSALVTEAVATPLWPSWLPSGQLTAPVVGTNALGAESGEETAAEGAATEPASWAATTSSGVSLLSYVQPLTGSQAGEEMCAPSVASWQHANGFDPPQSACTSALLFQHEEQGGVSESAYVPALSPPLPTPPQQQQQPEWGLDNELLSPKQEQRPERRWQQQDGPPSLQRGASSSSSESSSVGRPRTSDAAALTVRSDSQERRLVLPAFPVERLQTAMGSGLSAMRDRLKTAVERESHLRFETEMAAVDREELVQARALAEANAEMDRQARQQAELEAQRLSSSLEEERRRSQLEAAQLRGELKASHAAVRALEKQVVRLQAELNAEVQRRQAAEQQLERRMLQQGRASLRQGMLQAPGGSSYQALPPLPSAPPSAQPHSEQSPSKLPFLGRLQTEQTTPHRPSRNAHPLLQDVKQWLQSKQQEAAPWGPPPPIPSPPRSHTGSFRQHAATRQAQEAVLAEQQQQQQQQVSTAAPWQQQQEQEQQAGPAACWEQLERAPPSMPAPHEAQGYPPAQPGPASAPRSRLWLRQGPRSSPTGSSASATEPDSPGYQQQASLSSRRRQGASSGAWTFKPAWNDGWGSSPSPRAAAGRGGTAGPGRGPVDQVLSDLNEGLEQLRRSYSPPGSPYHTTSTLPARVPQQLHSQAPPQQAQQQYMAQPAMMQPVAAVQQQGSWGFPPAPTIPMAIPPACGFDTRPITSLLMPSLPSLAAPANPQGSGGAPIIQYISTYHSPNSGGGQPVAGGDTGGRPPTSAVPSMPPPPWTQHPIAAANAVQSLPMYHNHYALPSQLQVAPPQQALPMQPQHGQLQVPLSVLEQRPHTPAVGLAPGAAPMPVPYIATAAQQQQAQQQQQQQLEGFASAAPPTSMGIPAAGLPSRHTTGGARVPGTARPPYTAWPRSPGRSKDKPLAVPPQQMDESALEAARVQYMLDKHLIRAKRMRELAESPDFSLGAG